MSRSILSLGVIAVIIVSGASMPARGQGPPCELPALVPTFMNIGAAGTLLDFAEALAKARISAGLVVSDDDARRGTSRLWYMPVPDEGRAPDSR